MPSRSLKALPQESVNQLAHLLQTLPHERGLGYSERVEKTLKHLPSDLKHRSRLSNLFCTNVPSPIVEARLCLLHKPVSISLIHEVFTLLSLEVGHHCNSMTQHNTWFTTGQNATIQRLRELHSLWLPAETYTQTLLSKPNQKWPHQKSGCEGCILTRIGSDLDIVVELRTLLMSRKHRATSNKEPPRLLRFVEAWVVGLFGTGERGREVMQGSEVQAEELKINRKKIWRERKEKKKPARGKGMAAEKVEMKEDSKDKEKEKEHQEVNMEEEAYDSGFENEIIDHYAALRSTLYMPSKTFWPEQVPSLTTGSSAQTPISQTEIPEVPHLDRSRYPKASSVYSVHQSNFVSTYEPPRRGQAWRGQASAGKQAEEYRNLLTPPPEERLPRSKFVKKEHKRQEPKRHRPLLTPAPEKPLPRSKPVKKEERRKEPRGPRPQLPSPPSEPLPNSKPARKEEKKRQTTWSQFCE
jgi:hypothetical protein